MTRLKSPAVQFLIVEDHMLVRDALVLLLGELADDVRVLQAGTLAGALEKIKANDKLDLIILDLLLPDISGIAGLRAIRSIAPKTKVVVLSGNYARKDVMKAFEHGAAGFIPKSMSTDSLINALKVVLSGEKYIPSDILLTIGDTSDPLSNLESDNPLRQMTKRQIEVLGLLTRGLTNKVIADKLGIEEVTAKLHVKNILHKIGAKNRTEAVRKALDLGWEI